MVVLWRLSQVTSLRKAITSHLILIEMSVVKSSPCSWVLIPMITITYLAVAAAVAAFRERTVNRIILTRPAVEAGERLGFLPGDLQNKVDPYLRPLYDALYDMLGPETFQKYQERGSAFKLFFAFSKVSMADS